MTAPEFQTCASCGHTKAWHEEHRPRHPFRTKPKPKAKQLKSPTRSIKVPVIVITSDRFRLVLVEYDESKNEVVIEERKTDAAGGDRWTENARFNSFNPLTQLIEALVRKVGGAP